MCTVLTPVLRLKSVMNEGGITLNQDLSRENEQLLGSWSFQLIVHPEQGENRFRSVSQHVQWVTEIYAEVRDLEATFPMVMVSSRRSVYNHSLLRLSDETVVDICAIAMVFVEVSYGSYECILSLMAEYQVAVRPLVDTL